MFYGFISHFEHVIGNKFIIELSMFPFAAVLLSWPSLNVPLSLSIIMTRSYLFCRLSHVIDSSLQSIQLGYLFHIYQSYNLHTNRSQQSSKSY